MPAPGKSLLSNTEIRLALIAALAFVVVAGFSLIA